MQDSGRIVCYKALSQLLPPVDLEEYFLPAAQKRASPCSGLKWRKLAHTLRLSTNDNVVYDNQKTTTTIRVSFSICQESPSDAARSLVTRLLKWRKAEKKMSDKPKTLLDYTVRGILMGGSVGVFAGLLFIDMSRGLFLGMLCGALAGITLHNKQAK